MPFDPKAYLAELDAADPPAPAPVEASLEPKVPPKPAFDPKAYLSALDAEEESNGKPSVTESAARGIAQGISFGWSDEITAALESAFTSKTYDQAVGEARANNAAAKEENPWAYGAGEVGGAVASGLATGGALGAAKLGLTGVKAAAAIGGVEGALSGAGSAEGASNSIKNALVGGLGGAAVGATAGKLFGKFADDAAESVASKATAPKESSGALGAVATGIALVTDVATGGAAYVAGKAGKAISKQASAALARLADGAAKGNLTKAMWLDAIKAGVPAGTAAGAVSAMKHKPEWLTDQLNELTD